MTVTLPILGLAFLLFGDDAGQRLRGLIGLLLGAGLCFWAWQFFRRPVAPRDDADSSAS